MKLKLNEAPIDRIIRVIVGIALLALGLFGVAAGIWMWVATILGAILLVTGIVGFCPLYALFKISTAKK
jgi:cytochrome b subunit of formate dehydrogenase